MIKLIIIFIRINNDTSTATTTTTTTTTTILISTYDVFGTIMHARLFVFSIRNL